MQRAFFPRSRGAGDGRGPQVGPGTIDTRSSEFSTKPNKLNAIVWSQGSSQPDIEVWCLLTSGVAANDQFHQVKAKSPFEQFLWMDLVPEPESFVPPVTPLEGELEQALKSYATARYFTKHGVQVQDVNWTVKIARPFQKIPAPITQRKFEDGLYQIRQEDSGSGLAPTAWVWVERDREIWLHYLPDQVGGFSFVGTPLPGTTQLHTDTKLSIEDFKPPNTPDLDKFGASILQLKTDIRTAAGSIVESEQQLSVHDFRISDDI
ncbi:MAG: hypothetical protein AAF533_04335 [Acidobacteriota bacterium]